MKGMAEPGWYPDPDGSEHPRYWDGQRWSETASTPTTRSGHRSWGTLAAGLVAVALVVSLLIFQPWRSTPWGSTPVDTNSARPTGSQWNELEPTETPSSQQPTDGAGRPVACPIVTDPTFPDPQNGWFVSGGMKYRGVPGWPAGSARTIDFATERSGQEQQVARRWVSVTAIGQLSKKDYSSDPNTAAQQLIDCLSTSYFYEALDRVEVLESNPLTTSDGVSGWMIRANFWNIPDRYEVQGDEVVVAVVDQGAAETLTLFHSQSRIEDPQVKELVKASLDSLQRA